MKRAHRLGLAAIAGVGSIALLAGCSFISEVVGDDVPVRDPRNAEITASGDLGVSGIRVGDCFDDTVAGEIAEVPVVPCGDPHDNEIYDEITLPEGEYPGDDAVYSAAEENCLALFEPFAGIAHEDSVLAFSFLTPTPGSWGQGGRAVKCMIYEPGVRVQGTLKGAAR